MWGATNRCQVGVCGKLRSCQKKNQISPVQCKFLTGRPESIEPGRFAARITVKTTLQIKTRVVCCRKRDAAAELHQKPDFEEGMGGKEGLCPCTVDGPDLHSLTMIQWAEEK